MWHEEPLGELCTPRKGKNTTLSEGVKDGYLPYLGAGQISGASIETFASVDGGVICNEDDILILWDGERSGLVGYGNSGVVSSTAAKLVVNKKINSEYLYYFLSEKFSWIQNQRTGTGVPHVPKDLAKILSIRYPREDLAQKKIARILRSTDNAIEKTQALIAKYENIKQGMMQDLFTRGVDENGQLRPSYEEAPHLYQETELGLIPKDWLMEELRHFVPKAEYGVSISCDENAENVPVLRMNNIFNGEFDVSDLKYAPELELTGLFMKEKDVLFNRTNSWEHVGKTAIWKKQLEKASFASYMVRLIPNNDLMIPEYLSYWLQLDDIQTSIRRFATPGVQQVNINPTNLRRTLCSAPKDTSEQLMIVSRVQSIDKNLEKERQVKNKLKSQKLGLMQDLLTGKVRVAEDREERKEAVA